MIRLFLDLDGTLAKFNVPNALKRFAIEDKFFYNLKPYKNINYINRLAHQDNIKVYIISASPNIKADIDKKEWIQEYLPTVSSSRVVICRVGENKAEVIKNRLGFSLDKDCILLDDYTKNLTEWESAGGCGIKRLTSVADNSTGKWKGDTLTDLRNIAQVLEKYLTMQKS